MPEPAGAEGPGRGRGLLDVSDKHKCFQGYDPEKGLQQPEESEENRVAAGGRGYWRLHLALSFLLKLIIRILVLLPFLEYFLHVKRGYRFRPHVRFLLLF